MLFGVVVVVVVVVVVGAIVRLLEGTMRRKGLGENRNGLCVKRTREEEKVGRGGKMGRGGRGLLSHPTHSLTQLTHSLTHLFEVT